MTADADEKLRLSCERIERWHREQGFARPRSPATEEVLARLAMELGQPIPDAMRMLLALHDGCESGQYPIPLRATEPTCWRILPAAEVAAETWRVRAVARELPSGLPIRVEGPVAACWWSAGWIAFCEDGTGDLLCIDQTPIATGAVGQIVLYAHDAAERRVVHASASAWLSEAAKDLESGRYRYVTGVGLQRFGDVDGNGPS